MKKIDKIILALFSVLMLIQSILVICTIVGFIEIETIGYFLKMAILDYKMSKILLGLEIVILICAFKCIFLESSNKNKKPTGILMQNDNGKLLISKPTIENIVISAIEEFTTIKEKDVSIDVDSLNNVSVNVNIVIDKDVVIKELTLNMQNKIKEEIKKTSDLEVKEVNIKIKDVIVKKEVNNE